MKSVFIPELLILNPLEKLSGPQWEKTPHFRFVYLWNILLLMIVIELGSNRAIKDNFDFYLNGSVPSSTLVLVDPANTIDGQLFD